MIDFFVKYFWVFILAYAGFLGMERWDLKEQELLSQKSLNDALPPKFKRAKKELEDVKRFAENLEESRQAVAEVVARIETVQKQLPPDIIDTKVNETLSNLAMGLKMKDPTPSAKNEVVKDFYISKDFNFDVKGTFLQGLIFFGELDKLSKGGRILNVKYLRFSESEDGDPRSRFKILNLSTTLEAFKYNPNYKPDQS
ncbi:MAG: hypothetical protein CME65_09440 [Halobacteriovoraceae bacterium]|nr:hypothetical protein [Halobacteriovoraceae bacterium]